MDFYNFDIRLKIQKLNLGIKEYCYLRHTHENTDRITLWHFFFCIFGVTMRKTGLSD